MKKENDYQRRLGVFRITDEIIRQHPRIVRRIMGECIIVRAEYVYYDNAIHYVAISEWFDFVPSGWRPMEYDICFTRDRKEQISGWMFGIG